MKGVSLTKEQNIDLGTTRGVLIGETVQGAAAECGGLRGSTRQLRIGSRLLRVGGDVITALGGTPITSIDGLIALLESRTNVGQKLEVTFWHDDRGMRATVTLTERPADQ